jgi:hypothetical protein
MYLVSIEYGFQQFRTALQNKDNIGISIWEKTMKNVFRYLIKSSYDREPKDINYILENIHNFIIRYNGSDIFNYENIKKFVEFHLKEIECAETLLCLKDMVYKELDY